MGHTRKILAQAGASLADVYQIEGSVVGLEDLDVEDIKGVHDLGPQIQSERLRAFITVIDSTAILQTITFGVGTADFPDCVNRVVSCAVVVDDASRLSHCSVCIKEGSTGIEYPIFVWDDGDDESSPYIWDDGGGSAPLTILRPIHQMNNAVPCIVSRAGDAGDMPNMIFRGLSTTFGAGTVRARAILQIIRPATRFPTPGEPSSHGLPIPSW